MLWLTAWLSLRLSWGWVNANEPVQLLIFYCPSPDFTSGCADCRADTRGHFNCLSVGNKQSLCPLMWGGTREKWGGTSKNFRPALRAGIMPPTCKLLPTPLLEAVVLAFTACLEPIWYAGHCASGWCSICQPLAHTSASSSSMASWIHVSLSSKITCRLLMVG